MLNNLIKLANHLDSRGLQKEADYLDSIISKVAQMEEDGEDFDFFDEEESEESGPLQIDLGPDAVKKVPMLVSAEPLSLESMGFKLEVRKPKPTSTFHLSYEDTMGAAPIAKMIAETTGHAFVSLGDPGYNKFVAAELINGKPGMMLQNVVGVKSDFGPDMYLLILKTYDERGRDIFYSKEYPSLEAIMEEESVLSKERGMPPVDEIDDRFNP
jgi:hypothetical protein